MYYIKRVLIIALVMILLLIIASAVLLLYLRSGHWRPYRDEVTELYEYRYYRELGRTTIKALTEQGQQLEILDLPYEYKGTPVTELGYHQGLIDYLLTSSAVKTVYVPYTATYIELDFPNLEQIFVCRLIYGLSSDAIIFVPSGNYETVISHSTKNQHGNPIEIIKKANISFNFNYEESPNEGYFRIDNTEYGGKITQPQYQPKREGYTFAGWYKDADCTDAWDFENDLTPEEAVDDEGVAVYQETILYAKWSKI